MRYVGGMWVHIYDYNFLFFCLLFWFVFITFCVCLTAWGCHKICGRSIQFRFISFEIEIEERCVWWVQCTQAKTKAKLNENRSLRSKNQMWSNQLWFQQWHCCSRTIWWCLDDKRSKRGGLQWRRISFICGTSALHFHTHTTTESQHHVIYVISIWFFSHFLFRLFFRCASSDVRQHLR